MAWWKKPVGAQVVPTEEPGVEIELEVPSELAPAAATVATRTQPMIVNPDDRQKIENALYRISAIHRHLEAHGEVSPQRMQEFRNETRLHALALLTAGQVDEAGHDEILKSIGIGV